MFSMAARAKYDAWVAQAGKQANVQDARARYVEIATRIGWKGEGLNDADGDVDLDNLSEDDEKERERVKALSATGAVKGKGKDGAAGAMGGRVSIMAQENHGGSRFDESIPLSYIDHSLADRTLFMMPLWKTTSRCSRV